jgi:hypothetical protein
LGWEAMTRRQATRLDVGPQGLGDGQIFGSVSVFDPRYPRQHVFLILLSFYLWII